MSDLFTVNKSPFEKSSLDSCLRFSQPGAAILMLEDAVYGAVRGTACEAKITAALEDRKIYVLGPDLKARGLSEDRLLEGVELVDYPGFVDLVTGHDKVQAWL